MEKNEGSQCIPCLFDIEAQLDQFNWEPLKAGVEISRIYGDDKGGPSAALLRYAPGAVVSLHKHTGYEHILVLAGSQTDGAKVFEKGSLIISAPGSQHRIHSETGCVVLAIWQMPVSFIEDI